MTRIRPDIGALPGSSIGGLALILGPLTFLTGTLLRAIALYLNPSAAQVTDAGFAFPSQLAIAEAHPQLARAGYGLFFVGTVLLGFVAIALAQLVARTSPFLGAWGGALVVLGLFKRAFHAGIDHFAFELVRARGLPDATKVVADAYVDLSYGPFWFVGTLGFAYLFGWILLAVGAYRSRLMGIPAACAIGLMAVATPMGVLKNVGFVSALSAAALAIVLVPLGLRMLTRRTSQVD